MSTSIFTDDELNGMYNIDLYNQNVLIEKGLSLPTNANINLEISAIEDAPELAYAEVVISASDIEEAKLVFNSINNDADFFEDNSVAIASVDFSKALPPFTVPDLQPGYHKITVTLYSKSKVVLSESTATFLLLFDDSNFVEKDISASSDTKEKLSAESLAVYPNLVQTDSTALVVLDLTCPTNLDPFIRWKLNGVEQKSGFLSEDANMFPWQTPDYTGVFALVAEVFPFEPPEAEDIEPYSKAQIKIPVSINSSPKEQFWSHFSFDANIDDLGTRPQLSKPELIGSPKLDFFASGFGYNFNSEAGVYSENSILPVSESTENLPKANTVFSIICQLAFPLQKLSQDDASQNGYIFRSYNDDGTTFAIGVEDSVPYIESFDNKIYSNTSLTSNLSTIAVTVEQSSEDDKLANVSLFINNVQVTSGQIGNAVFSSKSDHCQIAGFSGYNAIYSDFVVTDKPYYAWRLLNQSIHSSNFIAASNFESNTLDSDSGLELLDATYSIANGKLILNNLSKLSLQEDIESPNGITASFTLNSGNASVLLPLASNRILQITSDNKIFIDDQLVLENTNIVNEQFMFSIETLPSVLNVYNSKNSLIFSINDTASVSSIIIEAKEDKTEISKLVFIKYKLILSEKPKDSVLIKNTNLEKNSIAPTVVSQIITTTKQSDLAVAEVTNL